VISVRSRPNREQIYGPESAGVHRERYLTYQIRKWTVVRNNHAGHFNLVAGGLLAALVQAATAGSVMAQTTSQSGGGAKTLERVILVLLGGTVGFATRWILAERRERWALRRSIPQLRAEAYKRLWPLCEPCLAVDRKTRALKLKAWYSDDGGGLFLSLSASKRYFSALAGLEKGELTDSEEEGLNADLTWLRTQLKYHVGSYSWHEAKSQI
jgi:hypothetical protein